MFAYPYPISNIKFMKSIAIFFEVVINVMDNPVKTPVMNVTSVLNNQLEVLPGIFGYLIGGAGERRGHEMLVQGG